MSNMALLERFSQEVNVSDRLRAGTYVIASLVLAWFWLLLSDANIALARKSLDASNHYLDLESVGSLPDWQQRLAQEQQLGGTLTSRLWRESTENQTLAAIQSAVRSMAELSEIGSVSVTAGAPQWRNEAQGIRQVRTRIRARGSTDQALRLLALLEDHSPIFVVEKMTVEVLPGPRSGGDRINLDVIAYFENTDGPSS